MKTFHCFDKRLPKSRDAEERVVTFALHRSVKEIKKITTVINSEVNEEIKFTGDRPWKKTSWGSL